MTRVLGELQHPPDDVAADPYVSIRSSRWRELLAVERAWARVSSFQCVDIITGTSSMQVVPMSDLLAEERNRPDADELAQQELIGGER